MATQQPDKSELSSTLKLSLKTDSGFRSDCTQRISLQQWIDINAILNGAPAAPAEQSK